MNYFIHPSYACIFSFSLTVYNFYDFFKTPKLMEHLGEKSIPCHNVKKNRMITQINYKLFK